MAKTDWHKIKDYTDLKFDRTEDGIAKITINRPEVRNAFRPQTVEEMKNAFDHCRDDASIGMVTLIKRKCTHYGRFGENDKKLIPVEWGAKDLRMETWPTSSCEIHVFR